MDIKNITKPVEQRFSIEVDENELKLLTILLGKTVPYDFNQNVKNKSFDQTVFTEVDSDGSFVIDTYKKLVNCFKTN